MDVDCNGGPRRPEGCIGRQNPPARSRGCSTPARNGAAEPRASPLYIGRGEELRRSCAPPCSRFPPPSPRAHARSRASRCRVEGGGTPLRGSVFYWSAEGMTSQTSFPRRQSPGRRMPHRPIGKRQPAIAPSQLAALWFRDSRERRLAGAQHPLPNSPSNKVFPGVQAGCDCRLPSSGRSYHSLLLHWPNRQDWRGLCGRSQPRPARVWPQDAWRVVVLGSEAAAVKNLLPKLHSGVWLRAEKTSTARGESG